MQTEFYVYEWFNVENNDIFYVGKGCGKRAGQKTHRNQYFIEYLHSHTCNYRIVYKTVNEQDALQYEYNLIAKYRNEGQPLTNIEEGGHGGLNFVWTKEMRQEKSENNPMKRPEQRQRMSENNPMKNPEIARKVALQNSKAVIIHGMEFVSTKEAAKHFQVSDVSIQNWCKNGHSTLGLLCRYKDEEQKPLPKNFKPDPG